MIKAINVTSTLAEIVVPSDYGTDFKNGPRNVTLSNTSDTTIYVAFGADNGPLLTTANGIPLVAGQTMGGDNTVPGLSIWAIHGGTGNKVLRVQSF